MKKFLNLKSIFIILVLVLGIFLRLYRLPERTIFNADQEWLASRAESLLKGDLPFLGQVTSVGNFSIGPGFIYLWAIPAYLTHNAPISGAYLSVFLGMIVLIGLFVFTKYFIDSKTAFIMLFLTTISTTLIFWDQSPWAPSLFYVAQLILLTGVYLTHKKEVGYILMALGFVLGFQSHFGILLSLLSILLYLLIVRPVRPSFKVVLFSILIIIVGLLPNIVFDLTHNFTNAVRITDVMQKDGIKFFVSLTKIINVLNFNTTSLIYPRNINIFDSILTKILFAVILVNAISYLRDKKLRTISLLLLITAIIPAVVFYIQQGKFSEYYLMMSVPSLILLLALFVKRIINNKLLIGIIIIISIYLNYLKFIDNNISWNLKAKENIAKEIIKKAGKENYGISLTTSLGNNFGFKYILHYYEIKADLPPKKGETRIFSIIIPEGFDGMVGMSDFDGIGLRWSGI